MNSNYHSMLATIIFINHQRLKHLHKLLKERLSASMNAVIHPIKDPSCTNFFMTLSPIGVLLSIAIPWDMDGHLCETALVYHGKEYLGYDNIKRFHSIDGLVAEMTSLFERFRRYETIWKQWIRRRRARVRIAQFIRANKDHFLARPDGRAYRLAREHFYQLASPIRISGRPLVRSL